MTGHGGNIHEASRKTGIPPERILDFSASINPLGLPKPATAAILKGITLLPHYPEPYAGSLTACIARHYDLAPESLPCGNGSTELIYLIPRVLRPKKVLITAPAFSEYERACTRSQKSEVTCQKLTREDNFDIDPDSFIRSMRDCNMAFLCNPNNPTPHRHAEFARQGRGYRIDHVWFVDDATRRLRRRRYDLVCLDNDLETEALLREGREVAAIIPSMPAEIRPRAVLIHSWNSRCAREMEDTLRRLYDPGVTLVRVEFGAFRLAGPGPACEGEADLRRWIDRNEAVGLTA